MVNSRIELHFNLEESEVFSPDEKLMIKVKLANRINTEGELVLVSESERSQLRNRTKVTTLFFELIEKALKPAKKRIKTKPTAS